MLLLITTATAAQTKKLVREGNELYRQQRYKDAAMLYQEALSKDPSFTPGLFNLGNSLYRQKDLEQSRKIMAAAAKSATDKTGRSAANYNTGNTWMEEKKWKEAVDAYKQALRENPGDADAKYNLSYALAMMKKQGGSGGNNNQQDKDKDKNDEQKKQEEQNKQEQQQKEDQQDKQQQPQPSKLSKQQADQLLNALQQEEKKLHDKMQKAKGSPSRVEKDW